MTEKLIGLFDLETTGADPETARIVTAYVGLMDISGNVTDEWQWIIAGVDVPDEAAAIHGYTTERLHHEGRHDRRAAILEIEARLHDLFARSIPVAAYNAAYDFTVLDREKRDHRPGADGLSFTPRPVLDPYVLDKAFDKRRKGSRRLADVAEHYGIPNEGAHDARADCIMTGRLALYMLTHRSMTGLSFPQIHSRTRASRAEQVRSLRAYFKRVGKPHDNMAEDWPLVPYRPPADYVLTTVLGAREVSPE